MKTWQFTVIKKPFLFENTDIILIGPKIFTSIFSADIRSEQKQGRSFIAGARESNDETRHYIVAIFKRIKNFMTKYRLTPKWSSNVFCIIYKIIMQDQHISSRVRNRSQKFYNINRNRRNAVVAFLLLRLLQDFILLHTQLTHNESATRKHSHQSETSAAST